MSTYINPNTGKKNDYNDCPRAVVDFLNYSETIRGLAVRSVNAYYIDLRTFFRFLKQYRGLVSSDSSFDEIDLKDIDLEFIKKIDKSEVYEFLYFVTKERDNAAATRARKLSSLRGFFKYMTNKTGQLIANPTDDIETPKTKKRLPKYLSLDESRELLSSIQSDFFERDYCIITLFLNCGMRLSELVGVNVTDIKNDTIRIVGKGNKERILYLNAACLSSIQVYLDERGKMSTIRDKSALFISRKTGRRLTARRIQQIVNACLATAGLAGKGYSVHKLRHTAATLMYQYGQVDMLVLKEMLGHANLATTEIYTHLDVNELKTAADSSPLSDITSSNIDLKTAEKPEIQHVENPVETVENKE